MFRLMHSGVELYDVILACDDDEQIQTHLCQALLIGFLLGFDCTHVYWD